MDPARSMPRDLAHPPRLEKGTVAAPWMRHVADFLEEQGLNARWLFAAAGLSLADTDDADHRFPVRQVDLLWHLSATQAAEPFIALRAGPSRPPRAFDTLAYAMMSCDTLGAALDRLITYSWAVSDAVFLTCEKDERGWTILVQPIEPEAPGRSQRLDYTLVTFLHFCRWLTGTRIGPLDIRLPYEAPADLRLLRLAFDVTPVFSSPRHAVTLSLADVALPLQTANARLAQVHEAVIAQRIVDLKESGFERVFYASLVRRIASGEVRRASVAADLFMSDRTLQRRMADRGVSFKSAVDEARRRMAMAYLRDPAVPLAIIGDLLGFGESSTLYRACRRWFGETPKKARERALG